MEVISKDEYLKIKYGGRKDYARLDESMLSPKKFSIGDEIHTIAFHYLEDKFGNDINQDVIFINPNIITGKYKITGFVDGEPDNYYCVKIIDCFGESGSTAYVGRDIIYENYI